MQQRLYRYAYVLAILIAVVIAGIFVEADHKTSTRIKLASVGTSLAASVIFAVIFSFLANREFTLAVKEELRADFEPFATSLLTEISGLHREHLPEARYPASGGFDVAFNRDITRDLSSSSLYLFRGVSAKYVPARVELAGQRLSLIRVIVLDPTAPDVIARRAADRRSNPKYRGHSLTELIESVKREIYMSVVALFDCRNTCTVEIAYMPETSVVRLELFDGALYTTLYHADNSRTQPFPQSYRFGRSTMLYQTFRLDCFRQFELAQKTASFGIGQSDDDLVRHLGSIGLHADASTIASLRKDYEAFAKPFVATLREALLSS